MVKKRSYKKSLKSDKYMLIISKVLDICPDKVKDKTYLIKKYKVFVATYKGSKADLTDEDILSSMFCWYLLKYGNGRIRKILLGE